MTQYFEIDLIFYLSTPSSNYYKFEVFSFYFLRCSIIYEFLERVYKINSTKKLTVPLNLETI